MLLGDSYAGLSTAFNMTSLYLPFVKIVHALAMREFEEYDFVNENALRDDRNIQSTIKQKATKIDFVFITFHANDKSKVICIQYFIDNFKLAREDAGALAYPTDSVGMRA
jgi:hypothetical protein